MMVGAGVFIKRTQLYVLVKILVDRRRVTSGRLDMTM